MRRFLVVALLIGACGKPAKTAEPKESEAGKAAPVEKVAVPGTGDKVAGADGSATTGGPVAPASTELTQADIDRIEGMKTMHISPEEGTLTIGKAEGKAGTAATADIKLAPGPGFHVSTDFPIKLRLMQPAGVKLEKTTLVAGKAGKGDAEELTEKGLAFKVNVTPEAAGTYEVKGILSVGVCEKDSCHPRSQPITIQVAAK
jgi:hypothetical protein